MTLHQFLASSILICACNRAAIASTEASYRAQVQAPQAEVSARVAGQIKRVLVRDHQAVTQGDALIELDDHELRARVAAAQTDLQARESERKQAEVARKAVELANARVEQARAALEVAQIDLAHATVTAEIRGTIALRSATVGQPIQRLQALATIVDVDDAWVDAYFVEAQVAHVKAGQDADVEVAAPGRTVRFHGVVEEVDLEGAALVHTIADVGAQPSRVGVRVKIKLDDTRRAAALWPGMPADVRIHIP